MIVSTSRRTDIPAYYGEWFRHRLREGYALVRHPVDRRRTTRVPLDRGSVDAFVFWTKDARPFFPALDELDAMGYPYIFQYTLNDYPDFLEPGLPALDERIATLLEISRRIGPDRLMWRYDPVLFTTEIRPDTHLARFERLCGILSGTVAGCSFKFLEGCARAAEFGIVRLEAATERAFAGGMAAIARRHGIPLSGCCHEDLREFGILPMVCVERERMERLCGRRLAVGRDRCATHPACRSLATSDIGAYGTCRNGCVYCYAARSGAVGTASPGDVPPLSESDRKSVV